MARSDLRKMFDERFKDKPINGNAMNEHNMLIQMIVEDMKICRPTFGDIQKKYGIRKERARKLRYKAARILGIN